MKRVVLAAIFAFGAMVQDAASSPLPPVQGNGIGSHAIRAGHYRHRRGGRSLFRNWCAYNCYSVPPCHGPSCYGRYGYSHYAYDEDIPFRYRFDRDASPIDNADAFVFRYTGTPVIRAFERTY
jgi:hypothetical protein